MRQECKDASCVGRQSALSVRDTTSEALLFVSGAALLSAQMRAAAIYHRPFVQSDTVDLTVVAHYALAVGLLVQS